jgi:hypothetical protein
VLSTLLLTAIACSTPGAPPGPSTTVAPSTTTRAATTTSAVPGTTTPKPPGGSVRWVSGANGANGGRFEQASLDAWSRFSGRKVQIAMVATARESWAKITGRTYAQTSYTDPNLILDIAQPMWPEGSGGSHAACASGAYDSQWRNWGTTINQTPNRIITRLGWEFNGDWWEWSARDPEAYKGCFRKIVQAVRQVAPKAQFEWNMNGGWSQTCDGDARKCYAGDDVVDVISIDYYDQWPPSPTDAAFGQRAEAPGGITWAWNFAVEHGKPFGVPEWGVVSSGGQPGGDNPVFVDNMHRWFRDHVDRTPGGWIHEMYFNIQNEVGSSLVDPRLNGRAADAYVACRFCH